MNLSVERFFMESFLQAKKYLAGQGKKRRYTTLEGKTYISILSKI